MSKMTRVVVALLALVLPAALVAQSTVPQVYQPGGTKVPATATMAVDQSGNYVAPGGGGGGGSTSVTATAAAPSYTEGSTTNPLSTNPTGDLRTVSKQSGAWTVGLSGTLPAFGVTPTFNLGTAPTIAVTGTFWQATQPVSGTFWQATQPVSAAALPLPTGASIAANQTPTIFWNEATGAGSALTGSASMTGTARDSGVAVATATNRSYFNAFFSTDQAGTARIDCSNDNSTWYTCATNAIVASTPLILQVPVMTRYHRAFVVNGSSAETFLWVNTSYTGA